VEAPTIQVRCRAEVCTLDVDCCFKQEFDHEVWPGGGRDLLPYLKETGEVINRRTMNWCVAPAPTLDWAAYVYPDLEPAEALDRLWAAVVHICRLDEPDPVAAWAERMDALRATAGGAS